MAQSLEELSSIYLESSEEGLARLSTMQPYSVTVDQEDSSISSPLTTTRTQEHFEVAETSGQQVNAL